MHTDAYRYYVPLAHLHIITYKYYVPLAHVHVVTDTYYVLLDHFHVFTDKYYVSLAMPENMAGVKKDDKQLTVAEAEARVAAMTPAQRAILSAKMKLKKDAE